MNSQEMIDRNVRHLIGDLQIQLIFATARITELEAQLAAKSDAPPKANGFAMPPIQGDETEARQ